MFVKIITLFSALIGGSQAMNMPYDINVYNHDALEQSGFTRARLCDFQAQSYKEQEGNEDELELRRNSTQQRIMGFYNAPEQQMGSKVILVTRNGSELLGVSWIKYQEENKSIELRYTNALAENIYFIFPSKAFEVFPEATNLTTMIYAKRSKLIQKIQERTGARVIEPFDHFDDVSNYVALQIDRSAF